MNIWRELLIPTFFSLKQSMRFYLIAGFSIVLSACGSEPLGPAQFRLSTEINNPARRNRHSGLALRHRRIRRQDQTETQCQGCRLPNGHCGGGSLAMRPQPEWSRNIG